MNTWTEKLAKKLKSFINHQNYILMCGEDKVTSMMLRNDLPNPEKYTSTGWFALNHGEEDHELDEYNPSDFHLYEQKQSWQEDNKLKVLAYYDDCGHMTVINISTPEQEIKILKEIFKEAKETLYPSEKAFAKRLIEEKNIEELYLLLSEMIPAFNARGGPSVVYVHDAWQEASGILT